MDASRPEPRPSGFSDRPAAEPKKQQRKYNEQVEHQTI